MGSAGLLVVCSAGLLVVGSAVWCVVAAAEVMSGVPALALLYGSRVSLHSCGWAKGCLLRVHGFPLGRESCGCLCGVLE